MRTPVGTRMLVLDVAMIPKEGVALLKNGDNSWRIEVGRPDEAIPEDFPYLGHFAPELIKRSKMEDCYPFKAVWRELFYAWAKRRAVYLIALAMHPEIIMELRRECLRVASNLIEVPEVHSFVREVFLEEPLPRELEIEDEVLKEASEEIKLLIAEFFAKWHLVTAA